MLWTVRKLSKFASHRFVIIFFFPGKILIFFLMDSKYHFAQHTSGALPHLGAYHFSELAFVSVVNLTSAVDLQIGKSMNAYYASCEKIFTNRLP